MQNGTFVSHQLTQLECEEALLALLTDLCHFYKQVESSIRCMTVTLAQAGFAEKALAIFQTVLEINLSADDMRATLTRAEFLAAFEMFFSLELPRFGEPGRCGAWHGRP